MPVALRLVRGWKRFRRGIARLNDAATGRLRRTAAALHAYRAVGAIVGMVVGVGPVAITGWSGGFVPAAAALIILAAVSLGLSVVRQLARLMGGDVRVAPGEHTIFTLMLRPGPSSQSDDSPRRPGVDLPFPA